MNVGVVWGELQATPTSGQRVVGFGGASKIDTTPLAQHSKRDVHSRVAGFLDAWAKVLGACDVILVERQPPGSAGLSLEILLRERYGKKLWFAAPQSMHAAFGTAGYTYDGRKERNVALAMAWLASLEPTCGGVADVVASIRDETRRHDIADALLVLMFYLRKTVPSLGIPHRVVTSRFFTPPKSSAPTLMDRFGFKQPDAGTALQGRRRRGVGLRNEMRV